MMDEAIREQLDAMKAEHRRLDDQITALSAEPLFDQLEIARLKRRKLQLMTGLAGSFESRTPTSGSARLTSTQPFPPLRVLFFHAIVSSSLHRARGIVSRIR